MRVHVVALPHTHTTSDFDWCAYTAKVRRFGYMLDACGHEMLLYGSEKTEAVCKEHIPIVSAADRERWFGGDWNTEVVFNLWNESEPCWVEMNNAAIHAINERWQDGDALGIIAGRCQLQIVDAFKHLNPLILEWGVGYEGVLANAHHCFESRAWQHYVYGMNKWGDGRFFDTVIPNAFDPNDYMSGMASQGYLLFLGRAIPRKGREVVEKLAQTYEVVTAGQGDPIPGCAHRGVVTGARKAKLIAGAKAVLVPTFYIEPFGGIAVEAMMSGVPAITTDFGAFPETVHHGVTGYRCSTLSSFFDAVDAVDSLDREAIAKSARARFSLDTVAPMYDNWLRRCDLLHGDGWYDMRRDRARL